MRPLFLAMLLLTAACSAGKVSGTGGSTGSGSSGSTATSSSTGTGGSSGSVGSSSSSGSATGGASSSSGGSSGTGGSSGGHQLGASIDALVGINGFIDDPLDHLATFGTVREYHDWSWNDGSPGYPNAQLQFSLWGGYWDFDAYYGGLADAGTLVFPAVQGSVDYLGNAMPPVPDGGDPEQPASYAASANFMFQLAARYGAVAVPDAELQLASGQARRSGLGYLRYIENGNEPDNNWTRTDGSYLITPAQFAAKSSADYDGDQGRLGATFGVKSADPAMKLVLGGLAMAGSGDAYTNATSYLDAMRTWSDAHRGGSFPADVINVHHYCFGPDPYGTANPRPGVSPEDCGLRDLLLQLASYRDQHLPGKELWLTEVGYDTDPGSNLRAPAIGAASAEIVQGQWLVRSVLAIAESGIDRATIFVSRDGCTGSACSNASVQFTTSGVFTDKNSGFVRKPSWYFLSTFRHALSGLQFAGTRASGRSDVRVDAFADATGRGAYVVWLPSSSGATVSGYSLAIPGATQASEVELVDQSATGQASALTIASGAVTLDVSETPLLVLVDRVQ